MHPDSIFYKILQHNIIAIYLSFKKKTNNLSIKVKKN